MAVLMDGKAVSARVRAEIAEATASLVARGVRPGLAVILVGDDPASQVYVRNKKLACEQVGFLSEQYILPEKTTQDELLALISTLNNRKDIHGILLQSPVPSHLDYRAIIETIRPDKDVDAFHPFNVGRIMIGDYVFAPCTPAGIMELLRSYNIEVSGKTCVVLGRSNIVGKPMAHLLMQANGTVTVCHTKTPDLADVARRADILVSAVGKPGFVRKDMVKPGAVVVDVGMNRDENGKLVGDVVFDEVEPLCSYITPVPGGVGPMTITMLLQNTLRSAQQTLS